MTPSHVKCLYITEKPKVGVALAKALPGKCVFGDGFITVGDQAVTWCFGHLLTMFDARDYDDTYARWDFQNLPIFPDPVQLKPIDDPGSKAQLKTIERLLKSSEVVVNAGDQGREGQLIVDSVVMHLGFPAPAKRLLIKAVESEAIKKALQNIRNNSEYRNIFYAAQARMIADWLVGINLSVAFTTRFSSPYTLTAGRVQSPTLYLVYLRCKQIESFVSKPFYEIGLTVAPFDSANNEPTVNLLFSTTDEKNRLWSKEEAHQIANNLRMRSGPLNRTDEAQKERPPKLFELLSLQKYANKKLGIGLKKTLAIAQKLYEEGYITYPRSDCCYLEESHVTEVPRTLNALKECGVPPVSDRAHRLENPIIRKSIFNDAKVKDKDHTAIIPTAKTLTDTALDKTFKGKDLEMAKVLYIAIATSYICAFAPDREYLQTTYFIESGGRTYRTKGHVTTNPGWRLVAGVDVKDVSLPNIPDKTKVRILDAVVLDKKTTPPAYYTEATLAGDMNNIAKFCTDQVKQILKETDGIGTVATQQDIVSSLIAKGLIYLDKLHLKISPLGTSLCENYPRAILVPDMTAVWELDLRRIEAGETTQEEFLKSIKRFVVNTLKWTDENADKTNISGEPVIKKATTKKQARRPKKKAKDAS